MRILYLLSITIWLNFQAQAQVTSPFKFSKELKGDSLLLFVENRMPCPFYFQQEVLEKGDLLHVREDFVIPAYAKDVHITSFLADSFPDSLALLNDYVDFSIIMGDPFNSNHDSLYVYNLPFVKKVKYKVIQGFEGGFSHQSDRSRYAIDFSMPIGDTICAAREGVVCWVVEHNNVGGRDKSLLAKANTVIVLHKDGTFAHYAHLKLDGALVEVGDTVLKGQAIALSGNTGYTTRPHLHFVVRKSTQEELKAVPILINGIKPKKRFKSGYKVKRR